MELNDRFAFGATSGEPQEGWTYDCMTCGAEVAGENTTRHNDYHTAYEESSRLGGTMTPEQVRANVVSKVTGQAPAEATVNRALGNIPEPDPELTEALNAANAERDAKEIRAEAAQFGFTLAQYHYVKSLEQRIAALEAKHDSKA